MSRRNQDLSLLKILISFNIFFMLVYLLFLNPRSSNDTPTTTSTSLSAGYKLSNLLLALFAATQRNAQMATLATLTQGALAQTHQQLTELDLIQTENTEDPNVNLTTTLVNVNSIVAPFSPTDFVLKDGYGYFSFYRGIRIYDLSEPTEPRFAGSYEMGMISSCLAVRENKAFICRNDGKLLIVDVTHPKSPELLTEIMVFPAPLYILRLFPNSNRAYIIFAEYQIMFFVDFEVSTKPIINQINLSLLNITAAMDIQISPDEKTAYLSGTNQLLSLQTTTPSQPTIIGKLSFPEENIKRVMRSSVTTINSNSNYLSLITTSHFYEIDIQNSLSPRKIAALPIPANELYTIQDCEANNIYLTTFQTTATNYGSLHAYKTTTTIINVSDPYSPKIIAQQQQPSFSFLQSTSDHQYVFSSSPSLLSTIQIFPYKESIDLLSLKSSIVFNNPLHAINIMHDKRHGYISTESKLFEVNATRLEAPTIHLDLDLYPHFILSMAITENEEFFFLANSYLGKNALVILQKLPNNSFMQIQSPAQFSGKAGLSLTLSHDQTILFLAVKINYGLGDLFTLNITDPHTPVIIDNVIPDIGAYLYLSENHLYGLYYNNIKMADILDTAHPFIISSFSAENDALLSCAISPNQHWLYIHGAVNFYVMDVSKNKLTLANKTPLPGDASYGISLSSNGLTAFLGRDTSTITLDLTNPLHPRLLNVLPIQTGVLANINDDILYAAGPNSTLSIINTQGPLYHQELWSTTPTVGEKFELSLPFFNTTTHQEFTDINVKIEAHYIDSNAVKQSTPNWMTITPASYAHDGRAVIRGIPEKEFALTPFALEIVLTKNQGKERLFDRIIYFDIQSSLSLQRRNGHLHIITPSKTAVLEIKLHDEDAGIIINPTTEPVSSFFNQETVTFTAFGPVDALNNMLSALHFSPKDLSRTIPFPLSINITDTVNNPYTSTDEFTTDCFTRNQGIKASESTTDIEVVSGQAMMVNVAKFFEDLDGLSLEYHYEIVESDNPESDNAWIQLDKETGLAILTPKDDEKKRSLTVKAIAKDPGNQQADHFITLNLRWSSQQYYHLLLQIISAIGIPLTAYKVSKAIYKCSKNPKQEYEKLKTQCQSALFFVKCKKTEEIAEDGEQEEQRPSKIAACFIATKNLICFTKCRKSESGATELHAALLSEDEDEIETAAALPKKRRFLIC